MSARYAIYFSPEDNSPLARYGEAVLGRDSTGKRVEPSSAGFADQNTQLALSARPAHYGFHATLKAPFHLIDNATESQLLDAVEALAARESRIAMHTLTPALLSGFMALRFEKQPVAIERLSELCVKRFEPFRAPMTPKDTARRNPDQLNDVQRRYLSEYGYPFVLSEFRFHMTLTGPLQPAEHAGYIDWLLTLYPRLVPEGACLDRLAVFWQPDRTQAFTRLAEFPFA